MPANPKEPWFFDRDLNNSAIRTLGQYQDLFAEASSQHKAIGEASTTYLYSQVAVDNILEYNPQATFIVMLRNPVEMAVSLHGQLVSSMEENIIEFEKAWAVQEERSHGNRIPPLCREPELLQYKAWCELGSQLERLYGKVDKDRVHTMFLEDMKAEPRLEYLRVLSFLGVSDDDRRKFPVANKRSRPRHIGVAAMLKVVDRCFKYIGWRPRSGLLRSLYEWNTELDKEGHIETGTYEKMIEEFEREVERVCRLTGRDVRYWMDS